MRQRIKHSWDEPEDFKSVKIVEVEISQPLPKISATDETGHKIYQRALVLARLHSSPLGLLNLDFLTNDISPVELAIELWSMFGEQINKHLEKDNIPQRHNLPQNGLANIAQPKCLAERREILSEAPLVSIVIATRDRVQTLATTLGSLISLDYPQFEIILVDNAPKSSETYDFFILNQARFLRNNISMHYVREDVPGLAMAHNRGLEAVRGEIVAFTDDDVVVDKYWLAEIVRGFKAANHVGCVTGLVIPLELQTPAQVLFEEFGGFTKGFNQQIYDLGDNCPSRPLFPYTAGRFGTGANMAFRTDVLQQAGGFDVALGIGTPAYGADDMAAFYQTIIRGHQLIYQPNAIVFHQHRRTYEALSRQMFGYGVGLSAFITKCMLDNPGAIFDIISKLPAGIKYAFSPDSARNQHKSINYPRELEKIEREGMLYGPIAYLFSRWRYRKVKASITNSPWSSRPALSQHYLVTGWVKDYQRNK